MSEDKSSKPGMFSRLFSRGNQSEPQQPTEDPATTAAEPPGSELQQGPLDAEASAETPAPIAQSDEAQPAPDQDQKSSGGWFRRLRDGLTKTSTQLTSGITSVFTSRKLDADTLEDLEDILIQADLGVPMATRITSKISDGRFSKGISPEEVRDILASEVESVLKPVATPLVLETSHKPHVILMVGVNGAGKTTTIGKLAAKFRNDGKSVMLAAGDTFRAAAVEQLQVWSERTGADFVSRDVGADAAGLAFDALTEAKAAGTDVLMIDTAGRLQNKQALMDELDKVIRVIRKVDEAAPHDVLLVLDATTGQNAMRQVEVFRDRAGVSGLIMTKLDGTARGGILVAISDAYGLPVHAIGVGEGIGDLAAFDAADFAKAIAMN